MKPHSLFHDHVIQLRREPREPVANLIIRHDAIGVPVTIHAPATPTLAIRRAKRTWPPSKA